MSSSGVQECSHTEEACQLAGIESARVGYLWKLGTFLFFLLFNFALLFLLSMLTHSSSPPVKSIYQPLQVIINTIWWKHYSLWKHTWIQIFLKPRNLLSLSCTKVHWQLVDINSFSGKLCTPPDALYVKQVRALLIASIFRIFPLFLCPRVGGFLQTVTMYL